MFLSKIKQLFGKIIKLDIVKVFSLTSISTLVKMLTGFVSVKVISVLIGPSGIALVGQLNNFTSILLTLATGGITAGVTKYISEYKDKETDVKGYIGTSVIITLILSLLCSLILILGCSFISNKLLFDKKYFYVFIVFGVTIFLYSFNTLLMSIINGYKYFGLFVKISAISSVFGLILSLALVLPFGVSGALINAVTSQSFVFLITVIFCWKKKFVFLTKPYLFSKFNREKALQYARYSLMAIISTFGVPVGQLILRNYVIRKFGIINAGCWEGMNRLSGMYLMIITSSFSVYYMPRLSELKNALDIKHEIKIAYKLLVPCMIIGFTLIFLCRNIIINILFSQEFSPMSKLFKWQLIGDFMKICSWLIAFLMQAKAMTKLFCITEIVFSALYILLAYVFTSIFGFGIEGVVIGYMVNYAIYLLTMYVFVWRKLK